MTIGASLFCMARTAGYVPDPDAQRARGVVLRAMTAIDSATRHEDVRAGLTKR